MTCPYCESDNWTREGNFMAEEWVSDEYVKHYIQCVCLDCKRHFFERVEYTYNSYSTLSTDQFQSHFDDSMKSDTVVWSSYGTRE